MKEKMRVINVRKDGTVIEDMSSVVLPKDLSTKIINILSFEQRERQRA